MKTNDIIQESETLMLTMKYEMNKYSKLYELACENHIKTIKTTVSYFPLIFSLYNKALVWLNHCKDSKKEISKEDLEEAKSCYELVMAKLTETFKVDNLVLTDIRSEGWVSYSIHIYFSYGENNYSLMIPDTSKTTGENAQYTNFGKLQIARVYDHIIEVFASSYYIEEIVGAFNSVK